MKTDSTTWSALRSVYNRLEHKRGWDFAKRLYIVYLVGDMDCFYKAPPTDEDFTNLCNLVYLADSLSDTPILIPTVDAINEFISYEKKMPDGSDLLSYLKSPSLIDMELVIKQLGIVQ
jgi:hypothetical protein